MLFRSSARMSRYPLVYDLAEQWTEWTRLPFVFAVWAVRRDFLEQDLSAVKDTLNTLRASREWGTLNPDRVLQEAVKVTGLSEVVLTDYFRSLRYDFGEELRAGLNRYIEYARQEGLLEERARVLR